MKISISHDVVILASESDAMLRQKVAFSGNFVPKSVQKCNRTSKNEPHFSEWISHTHAHVPPHIARVRTHLRNSYLVSHQQSPKLKEEIILLYSGLTILVFSKIFCCLQMKWAYPYCSVIATFSCLVLWKTVKWPFHFFWTTNITYKPTLSLKICNKWQNYKIHIKTKGL